MQKIKRNKKLDGFVEGLPLHVHEFMYTMDNLFEDKMDDYRKLENKNYVMTSAEAENIISALKSMPGFSMERFMIIPYVVAQKDQLSDVQVFSKALWIIYYMLSITNPELFEEASDENHEV